MNGRIDFSRNASVYDRRHGAAVPDDWLTRVFQIAGLSTGVRVLDVGAGTGRVAIPLARFGCRVFAVEPATGMLTELRAKAGDSGVLPVSAEGAKLPFSSGYFDAVVVARLLYLTSDWSAILHEAHRVLAPGGRLLHEWGNGHAEEEWARVRDQARQLFERAGTSVPFHPGVRSEAEVNHYLAGLGFEWEGECELGPGPMTTLGEFLRRVASGEVSYIWNVPERVREANLPLLQRWAQQTFDLERPVPIPRMLSWTVFRKSSDWR